MTKAKTGKQGLAFALGAYDTSKPLVIDPQVIYATYLGGTSTSGRYRRAASMVAQMDAEGFGHCTLYGECQDACPKEISIDTIARMNHDYLRAALTAREEKAVAGSG